MRKNDREKVILGVSTRQFILFKAILLFVIPIWALSGCVSVSPWARVGGPYKGTLTLGSVDPLVAGGFALNPHQPLEFQVTLPAGWRRATFVRDALLLTRDGVSLQYMRIGVVAFGDELPFTKKTFVNGMSPQEVAALELDEVRSDPTLRNFAVIENTPFPLAGFPGFKLIYAFRTGNGLRLKRVHYGVMLGDWVYRIQYQAPARYYFEKDIATFEQVRESFRITDQP